MILKEEMIVQLLKQIEYYSKGKEGELLKMILNALENNDAVPLLHYLIRLHEAHGNGSKK